MSREFSAAFYALKFRDFRLLWLGHFSTSMAIWMDNVARGWLMYEMTGSPLLLGLTGAVKAVPMLVFGMLAGVFADRYGSKLQIIISQVATGAINVLLAVLIVTKTVEPWHILATGFMAGVAQAFQQPARQSIVSDLVEDKYLTNAISLNSIGFNISRTLGPMLAGIMVAFVGVGVTYFFQAVIYVFATIWTVQLTVPPRNHIEGKEQPSMFADLVEGLKYIRSDKIIFALLAMALVPTLLGHPYISLMPIFAKDIMKVGPEGLGMMMGAVGVGAIFGAFFVGTVYRERQKGLVLIVNSVIFGISLVAFAFTPWYRVTLPLLALSGITATSFNVLTNTLIQTRTPANLRGRVIGIYFLDRGMMPLGTLLAGAMADVMGAPLTVGILGAACAVFTLWVAISVPHIRRLQ